MTMFSRDLRTIKDYDDAIDRLTNDRYALMLKKYPVECEVEYYRKSVLTRGRVVQHAKYKCTLRVQPVGRPGAWVYWVPAIMCEPENDLKDRTWDCGYEKGKKGEASGRDTDAGSEAE